ncbi:hypothetical protein [Undibacterium terreum]|uniref:Uncharacterized protein n=1 Tax=Undibacterium terreum TaxID=1224302 RepID=A0A916U7H4_9BURK|nr:hypothetical protein [Undibacterium terreum]GGC63213.1 hypothetical protein GCM10011396_07710 [Undibacterium terreum]
MDFKLRVLKKIVLILLAVAALGWVVMSLWNWLMPSLFAGAHEIDYARALGLLVLSRILFGGFHGRGGWHRGRLFRERWEQMTEEEREQFRSGMRGFRGRHHHHRADSVE